MAKVITDTRLVNLWKKLTGQIPWKSKLITAEEYRAQHIKVSPAYARKLGEKWDQGFKKSLMKYFNNRSAVHQIANIYNIKNTAEEAGTCMNMIVHVLNIKNMPELYVTTSICGAVSEVMTDQSLAYNWRPKDTRKTDAILKKLKGKR